MSEIKYVVPQPIKDAVHNALASYPVAANTGHAAEIACDAFAKALRENPIEPTHGQIDDIQRRPGLNDLSHSAIAVVAQEWQRRMFCAPEQEYIGEEKIENFCGRYQRIDEAVREAYRLGLESK